MVRPFGITASFGVIVIALAIAYYFILALPNHNRQQLDFQKQVHAQQEADASKQRQIDCVKANAALVESLKGSTQTQTGNPWLDAYRASSGANSLDCSKE